MSPRTRVNMTRIVIIPAHIARPLRTHLFQNTLEQGAFLFANVHSSPNSTQLNVVDLHLVPSSGWEVQTEVHLEMKDEERALIMRFARDGGYCVIDCHSHPSSDHHVAFSPSDHQGITDFSRYANWKLGGKPFGALVWGRRSLDGVMWNETPPHPATIDAVHIASPSPHILIPRNTWSRADPADWRGTSHGN